MSDIDIQNWKVQFDERFGVNLEREDPELPDLSDAWKGCNEEIKAFISQLLEEKDKAWKEKVRGVLRNNVIRLSREDDAVNVFKKATNLTADLFDLLSPQEGSNN